MAQLMLVNPARRPSRRRKTVAKRRRVSRPRRALATVSSTVRRTTRRYRRNPIKMGGIGQKFVDGGIGAFGALAVDVAMAKLPIPAQLTANPMLAAATKGMLGVGIGMGVAKVLKKRKLGEQLAGGAVTISLYNALKGMVGPSIGLAGDDGLLGYDDGLLGYNDFNDNLGWQSPTAVSPWDEQSVDGYDGF